MADDDDIRELIGRMSAAQRQGFHVTPAAIRIILAALRFYLAARSWLARPQGDPHDDAPRRNRRDEPTGPLPAIGDSRRHGLVACHIHCEGPNCWHQGRFMFDDLGLPDDTAFLDIARLRGFRCRKCGGRRVHVSPYWRDHVAQGNGKRPEH
jgi:hypothetical protein